MDRKAQIRAYKETPRPMGVFRVRNAVSGGWLIGRSVDLPGDDLRALEAMWAERLSAEEVSRYDGK